MPLESPHPQSAFGTRMNIQLIETMRVEPGSAVPLLDLHLRRLQASCRDLAYAYPGPPLRAAIRQCVAGLDAGRAHRLRLLLHADGRHALEAAALPATVQPVALRLAAAPLQAEHVWLRHKTTHRPWYEPAQRWLGAHPAYFDVLYCNDKDEACEGSRSNLYVRDDAGVWLTPPVDCGALPGVQRARLLEQGLAREARLSRADLLHASALRVSNALRGWLDAAIVFNDLEDKDPTP